jgi:hypothetical protein
MPYLILSTTPPKREPRSLFSWLDRGHIEILLWVPPNPPEAHALTVVPTTPWRIFLSVFWPQRARVVRIRGFPGRPSYWKQWTLAPAGAQKVADYLERLRMDCIRGHVRYRAITFNCFHVAYHCLTLGGLDPPPVRKEWILFFPTLGMRSFRASVLRDVTPSIMADRIGPHCDGAA